MKKQMMAVLAFSAMMTLTMPFASFAAGRSCQTAFPSGSTCASNGNYAVSVLPMCTGYSEQAAQTRHAAAPAVPGLDAIRAAIQAAERISVGI